MLRRIASLFHLPSRSGVAPLRSQLAANSNTRVGATVFFLSTFAFAIQTIWRNNKKEVRVNNDEVVENLLKDDPDAFSTNDKVVNANPALLVDPSAPNAPVTRMNKLGYAYKESFWRLSESASIIRINSDAARAESRNVVVGGIVRYGDGEFLFSMCEAIPHGTEVNIAESQAILVLLEKAFEVTDASSEYVVESDSQEVVHLVNKPSVMIGSPGTVHYNVGLIKKRIKERKVKVEFIHGFANKAADYVVKRGLEQLEVDGVVKNKMCKSLEEEDETLKKIVEEDKREKRRYKILTVPGHGNVSAR